MQINSYLTFNGNCREAMTFYQECFGGELTFQTIGDSPLSKKIPTKMKNYILHATLKKGKLILMATDLVDENPLKKGNTLALSLNCKSEKQLKSYFTKLATDGTINHNLETTFWGALFGALTDKFGNHWILNYNSNNKKQKDEKK